MGEVGRETHRRPRLALESWHGKYTKEKSWWKPSSSFAPFTVSNIFAGITGAQECLLALQPCSYSPFVRVFGDIVLFIRGWRKAGNHTKKWGVGFILPGFIFTCVSWAESQLVCCWKSEEQLSSTWKYLDSKPWAIWSLRSVVKQLCISYQ